MLHFFPLPGVKHPRSGWNSDTRPESEDGDEPRHVSPKDLRFVLLVAGAFGFYISARYEMWNVAIESAQVLAGLVQYPRHNSYYIYNISLPTLVNQIPAVLLRAGVPERPLNFLFCGLCGAFSFAAFSLWTLVLCRDRYLALIPPLLLVPYGFRFPFHLNYNAAILPYSHSAYSMFGVAFGVLALALLGMGSCRAGLFLLGLAPAVHPTAGLWSLGIGSLAMAWDWERTRALIARLWPYLLGGLALGAASFAVQFWLSRDVTKLPDDVARKYINIFINYWDDHRVPTTAKTFFPVALLALTGMALSGLWLIRYRAALSPEAMILLRAYLLAVGLGLVLGGSTLWLDLLPEILKRAIPGRYINLAILTYIPLVVGLLGAMRRDRAALAVLGCLVGGLIVNIRLGNPHEFYRPGNPHHDTILLILLVGSGAGCAIARWARSRRQEVDRTLSTVTDARLSWAPVLLMLPPVLAVSKGLFLLTVAVLLSTLAWKAGNRARTWPVSVRYGTAIVLGLAVLGASGTVCRRAVEVYSQGGVQDWTYDPFWRAVGKGQDWTNNAFFRAVHDRSGLIMTSGNIPMIQLRSRQPVLLPRDINFLTYFPEAGPDMDRVLRAFFGFGLSDPPAELGRHLGILPPDVGKDLWEERTPEEWRRLADEFQVAGVISPESWKLKLPVIAADFGLILYGIPGR